MPNKEINQTQPLKMNLQRAVLRSLKHTRSSGNNSSVPVSCTGPITSAFSSMYLSANIFLLHIVLLEDSGFL